MPDKQVKELNTTRDCSKALAHPGWDELLSLLSLYGVDGMAEVGLVDTSFDAADIRWNYIVDKRYVLRLTNAPGMTEARLWGMNRLIARYGEFGLRCPAFLPGTDGRFFHGWGPLKAYLSEYVDLPTADEVDLSPAEKGALRRSVILSLSRFMERYRDVDLISTMSMYSLFDLCPYDAVQGVDEKQENLNDLCAALRRVGEDALAQRLEAKNEAVRTRLQAVYKSLPRCVTQGDEGYANVLLDGERRFVGLIDFNLAGTDVCVNLIANNAVLDLDGLDDKPLDPDETLDRIVDGYRQNAAMLLEVYHATETERAALADYAWIALVSQYPNASACIKRLEQDAARPSTLALLARFADMDVNRLAV